MITAVEHMAAVCCYMLTVYHVARCLDAYRTYCNVRVIAQHLEADRVE